MANTPDFTTPVSGNRSRFMGITGNMDSGTAKGSLTNGNTNNSIGGTVYTGSGVSSNNFPVNQADLQATQNGGASFVSVNNSSNPKSIQDQVVSRVATEKVVSFTSALSSAPASGEITNFPKSTETIELVNTSSVKSDLVVNRQQPENAYAGITENKTFVVDELTRLAEMRQDVVDNKTDERIDGAAKIGDPNVL